MRAVGLEETGTYISRRHNTVSQYITTQNIFELYMEADYRLGVWLSRI